MISLKRSSKPREEQNNEGLNLKRSSKPHEEQNFEGLNKSLNAHIEMNAELKQKNEALKLEVATLQKELSQFKQEYRAQPLSKLKVLQAELVDLLENIESIIETSEEQMLEHMAQKSKEICSDAFALLGRLKELKA